MLKVVQTSNLPSGRYMLDCYMGRCIRKEISLTITTRTCEDKNVWIIEIAR